MTILALIGGGLLLTAKDQLLPFVLKWVAPAILPHLSTQISAFSNAGIFDMGSSFQYLANTVAWILIILGGSLAIISFVGYCGAAHTNTCLLVVVSDIFIMFLGSYMLTRIQTISL